MKINNTLGNSLKYCMSVVMYAIWNNKITFNFVDCLFLTNFKLNLEMTVIILKYAIQEVWTTRYFANGNKMCEIKIQVRHELN